MIDSRDLRIGNIVKTKYGIVEIENINHFSVNIVFENSTRYDS